MAAYRRVYGFGHLWADWPGPESVLDLYTLSGIGLSLPFLLSKTVIT